MQKTNRHWMPAYCQPDRMLPRVQETTALFSRPPFFFPDFVARALAYLDSDEVRRMGFVLDPRRLLPCRWKCSDESVFHVDMSLYAFTGYFPFDKGRIGGFFNAGALGAAVHHGSINLDFGGSHVGYQPGPGGGSFGHIWRPQERYHSTNCGFLSTFIKPFVEVYHDACANILVYSPVAGETVVSVPNEYVQPSWSSSRVKLLVDLDTLTLGGVPFRADRPHTHTQVARSLFYLNPHLLQDLDEARARELTSSRPTPIGSLLRPEYFAIFDTGAALMDDGLPRDRLLLYMRQIIAGKAGPPSLKAAIINTNIEHNNLADAVRAPAYLDYSFASFSGVFIDLFDEEEQAYRNLFQPVALTIKPAGKSREVEMGPDELHRILSATQGIEPRVDLGRALCADHGDRLLSTFSFQPGRFKPFEPAPV